MDCRPLVGELPLMDFFSLLTGPAHLRQHGLSPHFTTLVHPLLLDLPLAYPGVFLSPPKLSLSFHLNPFFY